MKRCFCLLVLLTAVGWAVESPAASISAATEECLSCHAEATPGVVADWERSRHAQMTPGEALAVQGLARKVSAANVPEALAEVAVGCAECHGLNAGDQSGTFEHNGYEIHTVVSPKDCRTCHVEEADQFQQNLMAYAHGNLVNNSLYGQLALAVNGTQSFDGQALNAAPENEQTAADSCLACHGTRIEVKGTVVRETDLGEMTFPVLSGWPNRGVGRVNPDGSLGSCAACHARHQFSIEVARKPYTCSQCHKGPDVPAAKVYQVSKHGNLYESLAARWDFSAVPWTLGKDFTAPTCAACHVSLLVTDGEQVLASRTHRMNDRLPWRIFGVIYAHPHPESADTTVLRNSAGLPLATELTGEPVKEGLISADEMERRRRALHQVCLGCHGAAWVEGHWVRFENTLAETNAMTLTATGIMTAAWEKGLAQGPGSGGNPFDEAVEKAWVEQWLFYGNSVRFSSAMMGADYGVFDNGRWYQSKTVREMKDWLDLRSK